MTLPITPVTNRTAADVSYAEQHRGDERLNKGALNAADLNRIETNCAYLSDVLNGYGCYVKIQTKTDWTETDWPAQGQIDRIRRNLLALISCYHKKQGCPEILFRDTLDFKDVNSLEENLAGIDQMIQWMIDGFRCSGTFFSGQEVILP